MTFISHLQNKNKTILYLIVFILFSLIIFAPSLLGDPFWDDWVFIFNSYTHKQFLGSPLNFFPGGSEPKAWPVFYTILWAMIKLFKANYFLYHLSNIITHAINGFLVWKIFERLRIRNAFLVALLFICHPLQLFTVSWIIQLKTIFSIFFLLVSIWFLIDFYKQDKIHYYFLALFFFVVSLLTKSTTVAFGAVIIFSYPIFKKKLSFKRFFVLFIMPFLILSIVSTVRTAWNYNVKDYLNRESFKSGEVAEINNSELIYSHNNLDNLIKPGEVPYYKTNFVEKSVLSFKNFFRYISFIVYPHNSESIFQVSTKIGRAHV